RCVFCCFHLFFFFQAEDGIRDRNVTGVQTCALPILRSALDWFREQDDDYMVLRTGRSLVLCLIEQRRVQEAQELLIESLVLARKLGATTDAQALPRLGGAPRAESGRVPRRRPAVWVL